MRKNEYWTGFAAGALAVAAGCILAVSAYSFARSQRGYVLSDPAKAARLESLEDLIDDYYLNETDDEQLAQGLYKGLIAGLGDRYSYYYTPEEYSEEKRDSEGSYEGIGVLMQAQEDGTILLVECYEGGPGRMAGLQRGDILTRIDDKDVRDLTLIEMAEYIGSRSEGTVSLSVLRNQDGREETLEIKVPVTQVELPSVTSEMVTDKIGYIQIQEFQSVSYHQFCESLEDLKGKGMQGLIIDLRENPGGYVDVVCDILRTILPEGLIFYTEDKNGNREEEYCDGETPIEIPLVVLVNNGSASASEIFAGAVKDYGIGTIIGTTTYGKGVVQSIRAYPDGSAVKLTVSHYYTPLGNDIHEVGITPDIVVEQEEAEEEEEMEDIQLERAIAFLEGMNENKADKNLKTD